MPKDAMRFAYGIREKLAECADPLRAPAMAAYMKQRFVFFGIPTPLRRAQLKPVLADLGRAPESAWLLAVAEALWAYEERECQYAAVDLLVKFAGRIDVAQEPQVAALVVRKSWWDSIDPLATHVYADLAKRAPTVLPVLDAYAQHDNLWLRRVAILYQLQFGTDTDLNRLDAVLKANLQHPDFFIRKAMGWALRQYARTDPAWVKCWLAEHAEAVPALTRREACKHFQDD